MKFCPNCGAKFLPGNRFCEQCGYKFEAVSNETSAETAQPPVIEEPKPVIEAENICPQCKAPLEKGARFCEQCGYKIGDLKNVQSIKSVPVVTPQIQQKPVAKPKPVVHTEEQSNKKSPWVWILSGVVGLAIIGVGGWWGYNKYFGSKNDTAPVIITDTAKTSVPVIQDTATTSINSDTLKNTSIQTEEKKSSAPIISNANKTPVKKVDAANKNQAAINTPKPQDKQTPIVVTKPTSTEKKVEKTETSKEPERVSVTIFQIGEKGLIRLKGVKHPVQFSLAQATVITKITTDHYNGGSGTSGGGNISILNSGGTVIRTLKARGAAGAGNTANAVWIAETKIELSAGTYSIQDSDAGTWSKNLAGKGFVKIEGYVK